MSTFPQPQHKFVPLLHFGTFLIHDYGYLHDDHGSGHLKFGKSGFVRICLEEKILKKIFVESVRSTSVLRF